MGLCRNKGVPVTFPKPTQPPTSCPTGAGHLRHCCPMSPFNPDKHPRSLPQITFPWETSLGLRPAFCTHSFHASPPSERSHCTHDSQDKGPQQTLLQDL